MSNLTEDQYERIAALLLDGVAQSSVAEIMGITPGRITQIKDEENFKQIYSRLAGERIEKDSKVNNSWDKIEQDALDVVAKRLKFSNDPEFALKAAAVANRATRRGSARGNQAIPSDLGQRVVIQLNNTFINQIQQGQTEQGRLIEGKSVIDTSGTKTMDVLPPAQVEKFINSVDADVNEKQSVKSEIDALLQAYS